MMKYSALFKEMFREIWKSRNRFLSILGIVAIGCGFFSGIKASCPDMKLTAERYFVDYNLMDFHLVSTFGFNEDDLSAISQMSGIGGVMPAYSTDAFVTSGENSEMIVHAVSIQTPQPESDDENYMNRPQLIEGRLPEKSGECVIDENLNDSGQYAIGGTITLEPDSGEDLSETLDTTTFTIVGVVRSPQYIHLKRGNTTIGDGVIDAFIMIPEGDFCVEVYTDVYLTLAATEGLSPFSTEYEETVTSATEAFEDLKKLENDLLDKIQSDANKKNHVLYKSVLSSVYYMQSFVFQGRNPFDRGNELKDIWKKLETYKQYFDFDLEKQRYEHELYRALKKEKRAEAFEINREKKTVIYTNNRFSEVYDFFRLLDRNAIPLHIGYTRLLDEDESDFVKILLEDYSYIGWFTLFRFGTTKTIEKVLGRRECIILNSSSENGLKRGFDYIYNAVNENIGSIQGISKRYHGDAYDHILSNGLEILKRLSSTTNLLGQKKLIRLMCKLIDTDIVKEYQVLDKWIRHIMYITEDRVKAVMLNELLTCSVKERKYNTGENPIDPFDVFPVFEDAKHFYRATDVEPDIVDTMLSKAFSDEKKKRYLVPRLGQMEDWKLLTDIQRERFASILWENIPDDSSLPYEEYYFPHVFLKWAHPREIDVVEIVKHKLLDSKNFEKLKSQQLSAITFGDNIYLRQIKALNITVSDFWEIGEIQLMMNGFLDYWEALHEGFSKVKHAEFYKDEFVSRSKELLHTIFSFCREQMQQMDSVIVERVKKMTNKMREYGIDTVELAVLFTPTEGLNQVIEDVINGLRSVDASKVLLSVNAAEKILRECGQKNDVYNIFNEMLILCLYRKEPGLEYCLIAIHNILYSVKDINLDEKILDMLYEILDNIDEQTSYEKNIEKSEKEIKNLVKIRIACASLAYQLYQYEMRKDICQSDAVLNWKNICRGKKSLKEFAEVKRRWFE